MPRLTNKEIEMRKLHVGTSPLTNRIYAGYVLKDGATWGEGKQDVTGLPISIPQNDPEQ